MTKGDFGESLKREREMRGISLDEISGATRIATRFLQAIENEQWDQLPGGVFNRGFVRAVARYLGLDEENIVAEYVLAVGDRSSVPVWSGRPLAVTAEQPWAAWIIAAVVMVALVAGGWFGVRRISAWRAARRAGGNAAASAAPLPADTETEASPAPEAAAGDTAANPVAPPVTPSGEADSTPATSATSPAAPEETPSATSPTAPAVPGPLELKIEADKKTKVTVEADSNRVFDATMKAGENQNFTAKDRFDISARDAGALLLELNGKTLAPIGPPGHAGKVTVTREALKGAQGGEN